MSETALSETTLQDSRAASRPGYLDPSDARYGKSYATATPDVLKAFQDFNQAVFAEEGLALDLKTRELIALAVGAFSKCVYCIDGHSKKAVAAGATEQELAEAAWVATAIAAGGTFAHGRLAFKFAGDGHQH
ncbi:carboxymuconolactone decarboxylase family protein [Arthrobacter ginkgonis]|uniref:Carboxymuconolactone decarboxylase family protein n=1 Tax=Arthrobacter ginkgonis TaxID=1630594 RepID=A0ABP7C5Q3_9MICC